MMGKAPWEPADRIMLACIAMMAGVIALVAVVLVSTRLYFPGTAGGGDALLMVLVPSLSYLFACALLVPCVLYRLYRKWKYKTRLTGRQTFLVWAALFIIATPPLVINLLPILR